MGESNARNMRGGEMDDIIFAGTATRPGRNHAEVTISLEHAPGLAPPPNQDASELEIVRRIVRGEGTGYRINGREARGRDVQTLFADIGSGSRASAMVSQGKVAALIAQKPEERRQVLEEAAGIAGLRARRHEAELKLRQAENNLTRADDLKGQLETQREGLKRQARQAARYRNLSGLTREAEAEYLSILAARAETAIIRAREAFVAARGQTQAAADAAEKATIRAFESEKAIPAPRAAEAEARTALERRRVEDEGLAEAEARAQAALAAAESRLATIAEDLSHAARVAEDGARAEEKLAAEAAGLAADAEALPGMIESAKAEEAAAIAAVAEAEQAAQAAADAAAQAQAQSETAAAAVQAAEARARRAEDQRRALATEHAQAEAGRVPPEAIAAAHTKLAEAEAAQAAAREGLEAAEKARAEAQAKLAEARRLFSEAETARTRALQDRDAAAARARRMAEQHGRLAQDREQAARALIPDEKLEAAKSALQAAEKAVAEARDELGQAEKARATAQSAHEEARRAASTAEARRTKLAAEAEGIAALLRAGQGQGRVAPILDSVGVPAGLEAAIAAALGETAEAGAAGQGPRHWRILPVGETRPPPGGATPLASLVESPAELARALSFVGLLPEGGDGDVLQAELLPGQALVDREGGFWRWDGFVARAGAPAPGAVRLQQRNRLRAARAEQDAAAAEAAQAEAARRAAAEAEQSAQRAEQAAREARRSAESRLESARGEAARLVAQSESAQSRLAAIEPQLARLAGEKAEAEQALAMAEAALAELPDPAALRVARDAAQNAEREALGAEARAREARARAEQAFEAARRDESRLAAQAASAESRLAALAPQLATLTAEASEAGAALEAARAEAAALPDPALARQAVETARATLAAARQAESNARTGVASLAGEGDRIALRQASLASEREGWATRTAEARARQQALAERHEAAKAEADSLRGAPAEATARRAAAGRILAEAEAVHAEAAMKLAAAETEQREAAEARRLADAALAATREAQLRAEAQVEAAETAGRNAMARIMERLGENPELPPPPEDLSDAAEDKARRKAERLTREREEMGPVNLRAEIELTEIEARIGSIDTDREEIGHAIAKLRGSIGHLNRAGRERLRAIFDRVDGEFRAIFTRLFGGGRAHLALVGSEDPLEAGLEIFAEPPGKKLSSLSLLSGGEQALTALSLVFAIFRCQPAPVCVLDEVDAPLDDANVERLCDMLEAMAAESGTRFLVVTHHPLTMARMHRLYGVTMQERGVSRLLSVDLGEAVGMVEGNG